MKEHVILVDEQDREVGIEEKMRAHELGLLHRAFSIYLFNDNNELLIQRRASQKYHCPDLWSNTCCGHPRPNETLEDATGRRLHEELGIRSKMQEGFTLRYTVSFSNGLTENEFLHVFLGKTLEEARPHPEEASEVRWISLKDLRTEILQNPDSFTYWFKISIDQVEKYSKINNIF